MGTVERIPTNDAGKTADVIRFPVNTEDVRVQLAEVFTPHIPGTESDLQRGRWHWARQTTQAGCVMPVGVGRPWFGSKKK